MINNKYFINEYDGFFNQNMFSFKIIFFVLNSNNLLDLKKQLKQLFELVA